MISFFDAYLPHHHGELIAAAEHRRLVRRIRQEKAGTTSRRIEVTVGDVPMRRRTRARSAPFSAAVTCLTPARAGHGERSTRQSATPDGARHRPSAGEIRATQVADRRSTQRATKHALKGIAGATATMLLFVFAGPANAQPSGPETITTTLLFPSFPSTAPYVQTYSGTFSATGAVADSGTVTDQAHFDAVPSPVTAVLEQVRTLSGSKGTLTLRCTQRIPPGQSGPLLTNSGSCVVLDASGAYAGLPGSGRLIGTTDFGTTPVTIRDTLVL